MTSLERGAVSFSCRYAKAIAQAVIPENMEPPPGYLGLQPFFVAGATVKNSNCRLGAGYDASYGIGIHKMVGKLVNIATGRDWGF